MFSSQSDNSIPILDIISLFAAELEGHKIGIRGIGLNLIYAPLTFKTVKDFGSFRIIITKYG